MKMVFYPLYRRNTAGGVAGGTALCVGLRWTILFPQVAFIDPPLGRFRPKDLEEADAVYGFVLHNPGDTLFAGHQTPFTGSIDEAYSLGNPQSRSHQFGR